MAPQRKKTATSSRGRKKKGPPPPPAKRVSKVEREQMICHKKIKALDQEESIANEDRFSFPEKERLLEAYYENGFKVFQDIKLLQQYFPDRRENDLKSLLERLCNCLQASETSRFQAINEWEQICLNLVRNFSRDKKISIDEVIAHALALAAEHFEKPSTSSRTRARSGPRSCPDYSKLLKDFSELLRGHFPEKTSPINAAVSIKLFEHINDLASSVDANEKLKTLFDGSWLIEAASESRERHDMALKGVEELRGKSCPSQQDLEENLNIAALCLELPKIKRIVDVLNPMHLSEDLIDGILDG